MRRMTAILAVGLCAVAGCQGSAAQEPYDGMLATAQGRAVSAPTPVTPTPDPEIIASEVDVPWTIALLSDADTPAARKSAKVIVIDPQPDMPQAIAEDADLHVAIDPRPAEEKAAAPKTCSGVVKSRS